MNQLAILGREGELVVLRHVHTQTDGDVIAATDHVLEVELVLVHVPL